MPNLKEKLRSTLASFIPTRKVTLVNRANDPAALAPFVDVDEVHDIIRGAENGDVTQLFALYRDIILADSHIQAEFSKRKLALLGDPLAVQPINESSPVDERATKICESLCHHTKGWFAALNHLLDSSLWPVAVVEKVYRRSRTPGLAYELAELVPVPDTLIDYTLGEMRLKETDEHGNITGRTVGIDPARYIVHRGHLLTSPDWWGGPMRSIVFWWLLSAMDRDWWGRFLERYGTPFLVGKYDQADDASRSILERAFNLSKKIGGLVVSRQTEVEIKEASRSDAGDAYAKFLEVCNREKSKLILGQTLSADAQATGMGSGVADQQESVRQDIRQFDGMSLGHTIRDQLFTQYLQINGIRGNAPRPVWGSESPEAAKATGDLLESLAKANLQVTDDAIPTISERLGFAVERTSSQPGNPLALSSVRPALKRDANEPHDASEQVARTGSAELAQAFRGAYAPIRDVILSSSTPEEVQDRINRMYADTSTARLAPMIEEALIAFAANGASSSV